MANWYNADGLNVKEHGDYERDERNFVNRLKAVNVPGFIKQVVMEIDLPKVGASATWYPVDITNNGTNDGFSTEEDYIPAGAAFIRAYFVTSVVGAGGTDFVVGTYQVDGDAIDADAILDATDGAVANMSVVGERIDCSGALATSTTSAITENAWVAVTTNGTFTAGKGTLVLEYILA